ncbi:MAG TPA: IPT/TIG domain-containing protein, partial [Solirubrobacterales bacterium]|nr:IPT/TIG domain-containing protein [Solirubrobacterales bacterium]
MTVGPSLKGDWEAAPCARPSCTFVNTELGAGGSAAAPVSGVIVSFSVVGGSTAGTYRLRTGNQSGGALGFAFERVGAPVSAVADPGVHTYPASLSVKAGQMIGLTATEGTSMAFQAGGNYLEWVSEPPAGGQSVAIATWPEVVGFDAEIQPAPTITALGATSGPTAGGASVTITGSDLEGASAATFGGVPATRFDVVSPSRIVAVAPPSPTAGSVSVAVTTIAGRATGPRFTYADATAAPTAKVPPSGAPAGCVVPRLKGKKLPAAKAALKKAHCRAGKVTSQKGATPKTGKVA